jgi:ribokinase
MDAIGFGAINLDKIYRVDRIPREGEEVFIKSIEKYPGGSAANTIVGLSRLGMQTAYIGKVGRDEEGKILLEDLRKEGVGLRCIRMSKGRSGYAMVFVDEKGNRAILVDPGVNDTIAYEEIDLDYVSKFKLLHLTSFVCKSSDLSFKTQKKLISELDIAVSLDPGAIYAKKGLNLLKSMLKRTTIFMPNEIELQILTGESYRDGAKAILELGVKVVVVKMGKNGCYITDGEKEILIPALAVKPTDTTGAGDAFNTGFLYGYLNRKSIEECGRLGNLFAALNIQKAGARAGLPSKEKLR